MTHRIAAALAVVLVTAVAAPAPYPPPLAAQGKMRGNARRANHGL